MLDVVRDWVTRLAAKSARVTLSNFAQHFMRANDEDGDSSESGVDTSRPFAQCTWVHAAVNLIAWHVAQIPFELKTPAGELVSSGPLYDLTQQPNRRQNWDQFVGESFINLLLDGHMFWERRGMDGYKPREVYCWKVRKFRPDLRPNEFGDDEAWRWFRVANDEPLIAGDELVEWKLPNPYDDVYGLAPLSPGALAIYCDVATGAYNKAFFKNGAKPGIVFSTDDDRFTQEQAEAAQARWNARYRGAKRGHQAAFFGNGLKPHTVGYTFSDMEFPELKRLSKSEILAIYHVPDTLLGATPQASGVAIGGQGRKPDEENFMLNTVFPWACRFAGRFNHHIARPFGNVTGSFNFRKVPILQDRMLDQAKEGREWTKAGATYNDVIRVFGLDLAEQPTGNEFWVPSNMLPARLLMNGPLAAPPGEAQRDPADAKDARKALRLMEEAA